MKHFALLLLSALAVTSLGQIPGEGRQRGGLSGSSSQASSPTLPTMNGPAGPVVQTSITHHTITVHGKPLAYTATAGTLPLKNDSGETEGTIFYVAYTKDGEDATKRPVTFAYNGGPGSSSIWLHLGALGPRRVALNDDGSMPKPPFNLVDNEETWLTSTDVVMIDAMGTGYSRPVGDGRKFYGLQGDLQAFGDFIQSYLTVNRRLRSPLFLAGESYGGIRTAGLTSNLIQRGIALNGAIIISGVENFLTLNGGAGNNQPYIGYLPTFAATAWYHKKLNKSRQSAPLESLIAEVEQFASGEYATALQKGASLSEAEKTRIARKLADYTGLNEQYVLRSNLRVPSFRFFKELLRDRSLTIGRYDARLTAQDNSDIGESPEFDASDAAITPPFTQLANDYLPGELELKATDRYRINNYGTGWEYPQGQYPDTSTQLRSAMAKNPYMKVHFVCGYYDMACPFWAQHYTVDQMLLRPEQRARISFSYYPAGHMVYIEKGSRIKLQKEIETFIASAK